MYNNKEQIKDRMLKTAARLWGGNDYASEATFDPLVGMLISACASELENVSREIDETRLRVTEKLVDMMVPDVNSGVLPAHALATAKPVEGELLVTTSDSYYTSPEQLRNPEERLQQFYFSPAGTFKVVQGYVAGLLHAGGYSRFDQQHNRTDMLRLRNGGVTAPNELWVALRLPKGLKQLHELGIYFDFRGNSFSKNFYYLLRNASWYANGLSVSSSAGLNHGLNEDDLLFRLLGKKALRHHAQLAHIRSFYDEKFTSLQLEKEHLKAGIPDELAGVIANLPAELTADMSKQVWLKVVFPQQVPTEMLEELLCSLNTFPVVNLHKVSRIFKSRQHLNLFAITDETHFFELESVQDSEGRLYGESQADKVADVEENFYVLRAAGVESFDSRAASEHARHLLEKLKNESASFNFLDKLTFNKDLKTLNQIMARLEANLDNLPQFISTLYLYLNTREENLSVFVNYRTTAGDQANGLKPGTPLYLYGGSHLQQGSVSLVSPALGGRSRMSRDDRMAVYKKALLTRDRIVSEEDLKAFCTVQFGKHLKKVSVQKGAQKEFSAKGGFVRTIDLYLDLADSGSLSPEELSFLCRDLLVTLEKKSAGVFPFRVFIDKQLIEA